MAGVRGSGSLRDRNRRTWAYTVYRTYQTFVEPARYGGAEARPIGVDDSTSPASGVETLLVDHLLAGQDTSVRLGAAALNYHVQFAAPDVGCCWPRTAASRSPARSETASQGTPVHGHETWGAVGIYSGIEHEVRYRKPDSDYQSPGGSASPGLAPRAGHHLRYHRRRRAPGAAGGAAGHGDPRLRHRHRHTRHVLAEGSDEVEVTKQAQDEYVDMLLRDGVPFGRPDCTPGYYNDDGQPYGRAFKLNCGYPKGSHAFVQMIEEWCREGRFPELRLRRSKTGEHT